MSYKCVCIAKEMDLVTNKDNMMRESNFAYKDMIHSLFFISITLRFLIK